MSGNLRERGLSLLFSADQRGCQLATHVAIFAAWTLAASASAQNQILTLAPTNAAQGTSVSVTFNLDTDTPPAPPAGVMPASVTIGTVTGSPVVHATQYVVSAQFAIPPAEAVGLKDVAVAFSTPNGTVTFTRSQCFLVTAGSGVSASFTGTPTRGTAPLAVSFFDGSLGTITNRAWDFGDGATGAGTNPVHLYTNAGTYTVRLTVFAAAGTNTLTRDGYIVVSTPPVAGGYVVVDTAQTQCYGATAAIAPPAAGQAFYGQDAQCAGPAPSYTVSGDGLTVLDHRTGLTWQRSPDTTGDGFINATDKLTWAQAQARPATLNTVAFGGFTDWRLPTIKEQYSLMDFRGQDLSGLAGNDASGIRPFIDTNYFRFAYGNTNEGDRLIDSQYASSTMYVSTTAGSLLFGVNFADGRIKGYGLTINGTDKKFFVQCVRGNPACGLNWFIDNGDRTVTDRSTGLMWAQDDSGYGMTWSNALAWVQSANATNYRGHHDWRLPNVKELQSLLDYTRAPDTTASAAIDPLFTCTPLTNENNQSDFPWYWSGTTHAAYNGSGASGCYVCFGRGLGYMNSAWVDVHGAGCQRSDPKGGSLTSYTFAVNGYYNAIAPQGDAVRIFNFVRAVRDYPAGTDSVGDGLPDEWRAQYFGGNGMATNAQSCAACDPDGDGRSNAEEYLADTQPTNAASALRMVPADPQSAGPQVGWAGGTGVVQIVEYRRDLADAADGWTPWLTNAPPTAPTNFALLPGVATNTSIYRVRTLR